jgi:muramoyltetrapeptide carboxypeptidase LdcA involved in peptidoglycan recycling
MMRKGFEYTMEYFQKCLCREESFSANPAEVWSDDAWVKDQDNRTFLPTDGFWPVNQGEAEGIIVGGAALSFNHLQGSKFFPSLNGTILFLESPSDGKASLMALDSCIRALCFQEDFEGVRGIVIGRYPRSSRIDHNNLTEMSILVIQHL